MTADAPRPTRVVVLGGGTAGWMSAASLQKLLGGLVEVHLIESEDIGIVGVGEATLPHIRGFVETLGIDEARFMQATHATYKLGIDFRDFGRIGESYVHPFGTFGEEVAGVPFHHYWLELCRQGLAGPNGDYSLAVTAALNPASGSEPDSEENPRKNAQRVHVNGQRAQVEGGQALWGCGNEQSHARTLLTP